MPHRLSLVFILSLVSILLTAGASAGTPVWIEQATTPAYLEIKLMNSPMSFSTLATDPDGHALSYQWRIDADPTQRAYFVNASTGSTVKIAFPWVTATSNPIGSSIWIEVTVNHADPVTYGDVSMTRRFELKIIGVNQPPVPVIVATPASSADNRIPSGAGVSLTSDTSVDPDSSGVRHEWNVQAPSGVFSKPLAVFGSEGTFCTFMIPPMLTATGEIPVTLVLLDGLHDIRKDILVYVKRDSATTTNTPPVVTFPSLTVNKLAGESLTLSATVQDAQDDCSFTWTFLQGSGTTMAPIVSPLAATTGYKWMVSGNHPALPAGTYQFRLTATEKRVGGQSSSATVNVVVSSTPGGGGDVGDGGPADYTETQSGCVGNTPPNVSFSPSVNVTKPLFTGGNPVSITITATDASQKPNILDPTKFSTGAKIYWDDYSQLTALGVSVQANPYQTTANPQTSTATLSFVAPNTTATAQVRVRAVDVFDCERVITFGIAFQPAAANQPPIARIRYRLDGGSLMTPSGAVAVTTDGPHTLTLDGTYSSDAESTIASYQWSLSGPAGVTLSGNTSSAASLSVPSGASGSATVTLVVRDVGQLQNSTSVTFNLQPPVASGPTARIRYRIGSTGSYMEPASQPVEVTVTGAQALSFNGSTSSGTGSLTYTWTKDTSGLTAGAVTGLNSSNETYNLNMDANARGTLVINLVVRDSTSATSNATLTLSMEGPPDELPVARIKYKVDNGQLTLATGSVVEIESGTTRVITLDGTASSDLEDGQVASHQWTKSDAVSGSITFAGANSPTATLTINAGTEGAVTVSLKVKDSANQEHVAQIVFQITAPPVPPPVAKIAVKAGETVLAEDAHVETGQTISLDASASECGDGGPASNLTFLWRQVDGNEPLVSLTGVNKPIAKFVVPNVTAAGTELKFELIVGDVRGVQAQPVSKTIVVDLAVIYFPQIGVGPMPDGIDELRTVMLLVNETEVDAADVQIEFFKPDGSALMPLVDGEEWTGEPFEIRALTSRRITFTNPEIQVGWAKIRSDTKLFGLVQYQLVGTAQEELKREISLFSSSPALKIVSFFDPKEELAFAIANPGNAAATIKISVKASDPQSGSSITMELPTFQLDVNTQVAQFIPKSPLVQQLSPGSVVIESTSAVVVTILKTKEQVAFSTLPTAVLR